MSNEYLGKARKMRVGNSIRKLILIILADNANDNGWCCLSQREIARDCEITDRSVRIHIKALEEMGLIEAVPLYGNARVRTGTNYRLKI